MMISMSLIAQGSPDCKKLASDCRDAVHAADLEIEHLKLQVQTEDTLIENLTGQRDDAYQRAESEANHEPWYVWVLVGLGSGFLIAKLK